ncbi:hypothetical protein FAZ95_06970 [Trinickia violacea]|uniref:Uncharacterized protein n=1 Tax=Trinickia violacea TaxID=2571746 RepID=A0A4P8IL30_9BURK|nr:LirA/MavJ family T4SS effector [Trinickia violacea]QCP48946.1 hypothetical protein FAZ95_06970 [Trinickia violacea]
MPGHEIIEEMKFLLTKKKKDEPREIVKQKTDVLQADYRDFGAIFDLFESQDRFKAGLAVVSKALWDNYRTITNQPSLHPHSADSPLVPAPAPGNLFTRCIGMLAQQYGFNFQHGLALDTDYNTAPNSVTLIANDLLLGTLVRTKLFWKDAISADHGEHSHSLQWLVAAQVLNGTTTTPVPDLYAKTVDYMVMSKGETSTRLWQLLVDCFPTTGGTRKETPLITDSFRCPQNVTRFLLGAGNDFAPIADHFVSNYLYKRYKNRNWMEIKNQGTPNEKLDLKNIFVNPQEKSEEGWTQGKNKARLTRTQVIPKDIADRQVTEVNYHATAGFLYMKENSFN